MKSRLAYTTPPLCTEVRSNYNILKLFIKLTIYKSFLTSITLLGSVAKLKLYAHLYKTIKANIVLTVKSFVSINYFSFFSINIT